MTTVLTNARIAQCMSGIDTVDADSIAFDEGVVTHIGHRRDMPESPEPIDIGGRLVTPGLVDCHTHLIWAGDRLADFVRRTSGVDYADMTASGGGILSTVRATAQASEAELVASGAARLRWLAAGGVTTVEVKSGYGIDTAAELTMLRAARRAGEEAGVRVEPTLLGAHAVPDDRDRSDHVRTVASDMVPAVAREGLAAAVDVFADSIAFTADEMATIFTSAKAHGLNVKAHVGQIADVGAAQVAATFGALSLDHGEHIPAAAMDAIASAGSVVVLVPGASVYLGETAVPPVDGLRRHDIPLAVTTDLNPGSSPLASLTTAAALAVHRFGLTPTEAVLGITARAADALDLADGRGRITVGGVADLAIWDASDPMELVYWLNAPICAGVVVGGDVRLYKEG